MKTAQVVVPAAKGDRKTGVHAHGHGQSAGLVENDSQRFSARGHAGPVTSKIAERRAQQAGMEMPQPIRAYLESTLGGVEQVTGDADSLWKIGERGLQMETAGKIIAGRAFIALRDSLLPGEFAAELAKRLILRSSAYKAIEVYELFAALPDLKVVQALAQLGITKAIAIKHWTKEEQLQLAGGKAVRGLTLETAVELSTRDFADAIRDPELVKAEKKIKTLEADREGLQAQLKEAKGALKHRYETLKMPDFAAHARQESVALAEQMTLSVTALEDLLTDHLVESREAKLYPEWTERAAGTLYHSVRAVHARTQQLLQQIEKQFGKAVTGKVDFDHTFSEGELLLAKDSLDVILKRHEAQAANREAKRKNAKGERGRPRKLKDEQ